MAARPLELRRLVPLPPRGQPGHGEVRRQTRLHQPASQSVRGVPAFHDPSEDPPDLRARSAARPVVTMRGGTRRGAGEAAHPRQHRLRSAQSYRPYRLRRARNQRRRHPVAPEAHDPGRAAGGRHRRLPQRTADQLHVHRDEVRNDRCGGDLRRIAGRIVAIRDHPTGSDPSRRDLASGTELHRVRNIRSRRFAGGSGTGCSTPGSIPTCCGARRHGRFATIPDHAALKKASECHRASSIRNPTAR